MTALLDPYLSPEIRQQIEKRYYARVNAQSRFEILQHDPTFMAHMERHVGLFSDHGVVHVRDVARQLLEVLVQLHGVVIPLRPLPRLEWMKGYGVLVTYLHDIGMSDFSDFGRAMHPEFAAQAVFDPDLDDVIQAVWRENSGNIAWHLLNMANQGLLQQEPLLILREMLALSMCHSKSKVPLSFLNNPHQLRTLLIESLSKSLLYLYQLQRRRKAQQSARLSSGQVEGEGGEPADLEQEPFQRIEPNLSNPHLSAYYLNPQQEAFLWLISPQPQLQEWVADVLDTLRVLRCADALRQRGAVLKTSGSYEIFVNQQSGNAVYALRQRDERLFLFESPDPISAGEANIASSEVDPDGDLRISFARGLFATAAATDYAANCAALVIYDIQRDVIESFLRPARTETADLKSASTMRILLEEPDDNSEFAAKVRRQLARISPPPLGEIRVVPSLKMASAPERDLYRLASPITWDEITKQEVLAKIGQSGHQVAEIDPTQAFDNVRLATVQRGQVLIEANSESAFVYIPLEPGLKVAPLGGYQSFLVKSWMPLGLTGVVRGARRNASVIASRTVRLLMIPKTVYLEHWHHTYSLAAFQHILQESQKHTGSLARTLTQFEKAFFLQAVPLFAELGEDNLMTLAAVAEEVAFVAGEQVFAVGDIGRSLYVVAEGRVRVHEGTHALAELGEGEFFGEMAVLTPETRMATVTAVSEARLLRLDRDTFNQLVQDHNEIMQGMITVLSQRLRTMARSLARLKDEASR